VPCAARSERRIAGRNKTSPADIPAAASGFAKLLKLVVEGLPVGVDAGMADEPFFEVSFGHNLCKP
jgi:hypothetical protein